MSLSQFLMDEMKKLNLKKSKYSDLIGLHPTELNRLLAGQAPSKNVLGKLAKGLNTSEDKIMDMFYAGARVSQQASNDLQWGTCHQLVDKSAEICSGENALTTLKIAKTLCQQDKDRYNPTKDHAGTEEQWRKIFDTFPRSAMMFYFVRERNNGEKYIEIAGDWSLAFCNAVPINEEERTIAEDQILLTKLPPMNLLNGKYDVVILNMSLINRYNEQKYTDKLLDTFEDYIRQTPDYIEIENFYINVYERDYTFFRNLGFEHKYPDQELPQGNMPITLQLKNRYCGNNKDFRFNRRTER